MKPNQANYSESSRSGMRLNAATALKGQGFPGDRVTNGWHGWSVTHDQDLGAYHGWSVTHDQDLGEYHGRSVTHDQDLGECHGWSVTHDQDLGECHGWSVTHDRDLGEYHGRSVTHDQDLGECHDLTARMCLAYTEAQRTYSAPKAQPLLSPGHRPGYRLYFIY
ncbi:MAG: hypothetical protein SFY80_00450 [Verrucomicrobiota bacterium]|nr:hypothetical protein [Verrucomicrobiota bacterium]